MDKPKVVIKIEPCNGGYTARKPDWDGFYHKQGKQLGSLRSLLNYVQTVREQYVLDVSQIPDFGLRLKLEDIIKGKKTVTDKDWKSVSVRPAYMFE